MFTFGGGESEGRHRGPVSPRHVEHVRAECADESEAALLGIRGCSIPTGVRITSVKEDSFALHAGLREGDVISAVDGRPVRDCREIEVAISANTSGTVKLEYLIKGNYATYRDVKVK